MNGLQGIGLYEYHMNNLSLTEVSRKHAVLNQKRNENGEGNEKALNPAPQSV